MIAPDFKTALGITIALLTVAAFFYIVGLRWAGYGFAFLNLPLWLWWLRGLLR